jgi:hypothetical protein
MSTTSRYNRRDFLKVAGPASAIALLALTISAGQTAESPTMSATRSSHFGDRPMNTITTNDGVTIFYKDWGTGQPIVFSHGWPLSSDDWDTQMMFF